MTIAPARPRVDAAPFRTRPVDGWTHHVVDLDRPGEPRSRRYDRPIALADRITAVAEVVGDRGRLPEGAAAVAQRTLTPRRPHQAAPLSYLNVYGRSWSLFADGDSLQWYEDGGEERHGHMDLWFRDVVAGSVAIVSLTLTVASRVNRTGSYEVRSSAAPPRTMTVQGHRQETVDIVVRPTDPFAVLVTLDTGPDLVYCEFTSACYLA